MAPNRDKRDLQCTVVLGAQWGDEGKGKVVDYMTPFFDGVARYQGGHNAGHTLVIDGKKIVLHLVPCGIMDPTRHVHLGAHVVISPSALMGEVEELKRLGVQIDGRLTISPRAAILFPFHEILDKAREASLGANKKIGTTGRGIGPTYEDVASRRALTVEEFLDARVLNDRLLPLYEEKKWLCQTVYKATFPPWPEVIKFCDYYRKYLTPLVGETRDFLDKLPQGSLLLEGAQGALLDLHQGTYPFVTSSLTGVSGAMSSLALPPQSIKQVLGIIKAYTTRVGSGVFPSELTGELEEQLRQKGGEFGATTGRSRRCGWLDLPLLRAVIQSQGITGLVMTKLDVLAGFSEVGIVESYQGIEGSPDQLLSPDPRDSLLRHVKPVVRKLPPFSKVDSPQALDFIQYVEDQLNVPIVAVGVGAERESLIIRKSIPGLTLPFVSGK